MAVGWWIIAIAGYGMSVFFMLCMVGAIIGALEARDGPGRVDPETGYTSRQFEVTLYRYATAAVGTALLTTVLLWAIEWGMR